jgi:hypothetical protein
MTKSTVMLGAAICLTLVGLTSAGWGPSASFDCAMRKLAYQYGKQLIPRMGSFESLYYALDLNDPSCPTEMTPGHAELSPSAWTSTNAETTPSGLPGGPKIFVHATSGNDAAVGEIDTPVRTIQEALDRAAVADPTPAVVLRGGTHYIADSLVLTSAHSGLHLIGYPGETASVSGGVQLSGLDWKPYNVTPAPPPAPHGWVGPIQDLNYVFGANVGGSGFPMLGKFDNASACAAACQATTSCHAYTWHDQKQGAYARECVGRTDGHYAARTQSGHWSGHDGTATPAGPSPAPPAGPPNVYVTKVTTELDAMLGLQIDGKRATIARYPNQPGGLETSCGYGCMVSGGAASWTPPNFNKYGNVTYYTDMNPDHKRNDSANGGGLDNWFSHYMIGVNGLCSVYDPPVSYWCSEHTSGGGAFAFRTPSGVTPKPGALPNSPYKDVSQALFFVWRPARWANWMFEVEGYDESKGTFAFGKGGNQGARGNNNGGDFFVQDVFEELDYPGEFFYNRSTKELYLWYNGTGAPPSTAEFVVPRKQVLVNLTGTQWKPVKDVKLTNVRYTATAPTYMERHGVPSAGDWALDRFAAVFLQGTEGVVISNCTFERLDGNAVMFSGYNRNATVQDSDFAFIGGNALAAWGYTNETQYDPGRPGVTNIGYPAAGVDGTDGEHPRYTTILRTTAREVGLYEKQSSFFIQAKTAQSIIHGNVFFNGPRAGINANDGFGGGDVISNNLVFSTCRESGDHGPFNSWDRQPFLTTIAHGTPSMDMAWREIHHNFFIDNYSPQENVDNDDGSRYYHTHDNFFVYGGNGMKNDFGGHDNHHRNNIYAYVGRALGVCGMLDGHEDVFSGNKVVMTGSNVGGPQCKPPGKTQMSDNAYFTPDGTVSECGMSLADWQEKGDSEKGSTAAKTPSDDTIIGWAKEKLGIH